VTMRRTTVIAKQVGIVSVLAVIAAIALYPIVFMVLSSFKSSLDFIMNPAGLPATWSYLENFQAMYYRFDVVRLFRNTVFYIVLSALVSLSVSIPASFAFAKLRFPFRDGLRTAMIATLIMPTITFIVPSYVMMANLGLAGSYWTVVLLWSATSVPGNVFLLSSLMRGIPGEVLEAARIDGASYFQTLARMVIPLSAPGIITVLIFNVTAWWNDLLIPLVFLQSEHETTVTVAAATLGARFSMDYPLVITGLLLASLPPILAYIFLQRYIRRGLVIGALK
jgi:raffinose/stachyose/melibiose transport system permease protein